MEVVGTISQGCRGEFGAYRHAHKGLLRLNYFTLRHLGGWCVILRKRKNDRKGLSGESWRNTTRWKWMVICEGNGLERLLEKIKGTQVRR